MPGLVSFTVKPDKALLPRLSLEDDCFYGGAAKRTDLCKSRGRETTARPAGYSLKCQC